MPQVANYSRLWVLRRGITGFVRSQREGLVLFRSWGEHLAGGDGRQKRKSPNRGWLGLDGFDVI